MSRLLRNIFMFVVYAYYVSFNSVWSGDENRIYSRMEQVAAGNWGGAYVRHL